MVTSIGMMDAAYFVGRIEILAWINSTLHLNHVKVEEGVFAPLSLPRESPTRSSFEAFNFVKNLGG
ncbi:hypothetical protein Scep_028606 [Stephania cephalantha]|uniref:Uncharacterized protein n=1 Tax=Stephania cephalantha TaxID=152367 RepID=A0AAP0EAA0_9MAGN